MSNRFNNSNVGAVVGHLDLIDLEAIILAPSFGKLPHELKVKLLNWYKDIIQSQTDLTLFLTEANQP